MKAQIVRNKRRGDVYLVALDPDGNGKNFYFEISPLGMNRRVNLDEFEYLTETLDLNLELATSLRKKIR